MERISFSPSCLKEINWDIVDFYNQWLEKQILKNKSQSSKCTDPNTIDFLKLISFSLANIEFCCEIEKYKYAESNESVSIKFPVYDKKYDLYTSEEASDFSEYTISQEYEYTILKKEKLMVMKRTCCYFYLTILILLLQNSKKSLKIS